MKITKVFMFMVLVLLAIVVVSGCSEQDIVTETDAAQSGGEETKEEESRDEKNHFEKDDEQILNIMEMGALTLLDSVIAQDVGTFNVLNNVNEGLFRLDEDNQAIPALAVEEPEISEDGLTYTFTLRDANWSDGTPITSADFVYSWQRAIDPATESPYGPYMMTGTIANAEAIAAGEMEPSELGVEAPDDSTLIVTLERQIPYFISLMSFGTFYPQNEAFVTAAEDAYATNADQVLYNGPFKLTNWDGSDGSSWTMEKNEEYWDAETVVLETINVDVVTDPQTAVDLYTSGEKDITFLAGEFAKQYSDDPEVMEGQSPNVFYFKFNQLREDERTALANEDIRRALAQAYDKEDIVGKVLADGSMPANYLVPSEFAFNENGEDFRSINGDMLEYNTEAAAELWSQGLEEEGLDELTLELLGEDHNVAIELNEELKVQLEENLEGLTIDLKTVPFEELLALEEAQDYDLLHTGWGPDYLDPMTFLDLFVTDSPLNSMSYSNEGFDALIESAKGELARDPVARWEAMAEAERILLEEDVAIAPIFQMGTMSLKKPYVKNIVKHPFGSDYSFKWTYISGKE
ncbi:oligopeptide transport system substrate-binding protein [Planomicrobium stackebrandtii]|uniref:Oligopeptide transport system substrate-binding protein n=1 Tax=Planomicrobium stackebrandtii TaxID=253160 RepID=A0ABU0GUP1_9BACL|nr:peptide ABC transporter substrate-binding protein [Planomicrobium stackebrandtii]MDQ0429059.1 oligopeptide transport system substrate-binding protein [Planomicrobium stackebrandtii]